MIPLLVRHNDLKAMVGIFLKFEIEYGSIKLQCTIIVENNIHLGNVIATKYSSF